MSDENSSDVCEEPDAEFFDTFFDDGVLETLGDVLNDQSKESDDSSCETINATEGQCEDGIASKEPQSSQRNSEDSVNTSKVIVLKSANIKDIDFSSDLKSKPENCTSTSNLKSGVSDSTSDVFSRMPLDIEDSVVGKPNICPKNFSVNEKSESVNESKNKSNYSSVSELHVKVKHVLEAVIKSSEERVKKNKLQDDSFSQSKEEVKDSVDFEKYEATGDIRKQGSHNPSKSHHAKHLLDASQPFALFSPRNPSEDSWEGPTVETQMEYQSIGTSHLPNVEENLRENISPKNICDLSSIENDEGPDLTLDDSCLSKVDHNTPPRKKKIPINLKTPLLVPTSVLSSASSSIVEEPHNSNLTNPLLVPTAVLSSASSSIVEEPHSSEKKDKKKTEPRVIKNLEGLKELEQSTSSRVDDLNRSMQQSRHPGDKKKSRNVFDDEEVSDQRTKSEVTVTKKKKSKSKERKTKKKEKSHFFSTKDDYSQLPDKYSRPRTQSKSPKRWKERVPEHRKRRRSYSRSPSPSSSRKKRYLRRSPYRYRSRSRSKSHSRKSSPAATRQRSRSRSKSPFINLIHRLKKQWDKEDTEKRRSANLNTSGVYPTHLPRMQTWPDEGNSTSTAIVSNMTVSVESVQVHSASFSFNGPIGPSHGGVIGTVPHIPFGSHYMIPAYGTSNNQSLNPVQSVPLVGHNDNQVSLSRIPPPFNTNCGSQLLHPPGVNEVELAPAPSCPAPVVMTPPLPAAEFLKTNQVSSAETRSPELQTSIFKRQLDILMSSVIPSQSSPKCPINSDSFVQNDSIVSLIDQPQKVAVQKSLDNESIAPLEQTCINTDESESVDKCSTETEASKLILPGTSKINSSSVVEERLFDKKENNNDRRSGNADTREPAMCGNSINMAVMSGVMPEEVEEQSEDCHGVIVEEYDSDVIIEEPPEKPPVELICLSPEEAGSSALYDLDEELNKEFQIEHDSKESDICQIVEEKYYSESATACTTKKKKHRKKKRHHKSPSLDHEKKQISRIDAVDGTENTVQEPQGEGPPSQESILKECLDMIDSLRIGRFVVLDDEALDEPPSIESKKPSSPLLNSKVELSFTLKPASKEMPRSRDASTNTPIPLFIDVCCGTDSSHHHQRDFASQTDIECIGCGEMKESIQTLKDENLNLKKERDELLSLILDISRSHSIPGLDVSSSRLISLPGSNSWHFGVSGSGTSIASNILPGELCNSFAIESSEAVMNNMEFLEVEPSRAYEYNHSSPDVHREASRDDVCGPVRPYQ